LRCPQERGRMRDLRQHLTAAGLDIERGPRACHPLADQPGVSPCRALLGSPAREPGEVPSRYGLRGALCHEGIGCPVASHRGGITEHTGRCSGINQLATPCTMLKTPKPSRIVPVPRCPQAIGTSLRLLAPMFTATAETAHRPSAAPMP